MRKPNLLSALSLLLFSSVTLADDHIDLSTPEAAIKAHMAAFTNRDTAAVATTSSFPVVQFLVDEPPTTFSSSEDLDDESERPYEVALVSAEEIDRKGDLALFKVRMQIDGPNQSAGGLAWWAVKQTDGVWRVTWRQWLGFVPSESE